MFEDLHWADPALLAFLEHLADWAEGVPLLLLCTARPELYERHPTFGGNARNAQRINLAPLSDSETAQLVSALLERVVLPAETQQALLEQAGGNPLYAEDSVRLLADRGPLGRVVQVPESVQSLISARLDTLPAERKSLLQDASVLGKVFWAGAVAAMAGRERHEVELALHELTRKELVRPARMSSMKGEDEYGFWHVLVRDVCYGQIPRAARAARHLAAAGWIEEKARERAEDLADVLAYHYQSALELKQAAGLGEDTEQLQAQVVRYLALAGERALSLDNEQAERQLARALELCPNDAPERASLLERWAQAAQQQGRLQEARQAFEHALDLYRAQGDGVAVGRVLTRPSGTSSTGSATRDVRRCLRRRSSCSKRNLPGRSSSRPTATPRGAACSRTTTPRRSRGRTGRARSPRRLASRSRHSRSTCAACAVALSGKRTGSKTCDGRSGSRSSRAWDAKLL
jgi:predicted ATPase